MKAILVSKKIKKKITLTVLCFLSSKISDVVSLKDEHLAAMGEVEEAHAKALGEVTALTAKLQR